MSTRATCSSRQSVIPPLGLRCKAQALPAVAPLGVGASGFSVVHICGAVPAGMRVRAVSHVALGEENAHTAAASASAIATAARGRRRSALAGAR